MDFDEEDEGAGGLRSWDAGGEERHEVTHSVPVSKSLPEYAHGSPVSLKIKEDAEMVLLIPDLVYWIGGFPSEFQFIHCFHPS